jgi:hypothetical protein
MSQETSEFRVRPVNRFVLTHYQSDANAGSVRTIGEFPNAELANEVAAAMRGKALPRSAPQSFPLGLQAPNTEFAIVGNSLGDEATIVHYAYGEAEATERKAQCEATFGGVFTVYSRQREVAGPICV